jgi:hypothetical protein
MGGSVSDVGFDAWVELLVWVAMEADSVRLVVLSLKAELEIAESDMTDRDAELVIADESEMTRAAEELLA